MGFFSRPHLGDHEYELGQIIDFVYYPDSTSPPAFEGKVLIESWDSDTETVGLRAVEGHFSASLNQSDSIGVTAPRWRLW